MHASLHHGHGNLAGLADHELSSMTDRCRARKCRNVSVRNADGVGKIVSKRSQAGTQHQSDLRAQRRLRKYECCCGFSSTKQVRIHVAIKTWLRSRRKLSPIATARERA